MRLLLVTLVASALLTAAPAARRQDAPQQQQRPVFRAGAHFVRVDAYPSRDGRPMTGLTAADFEILEDGKPQQIELLEFIEYAGWSPNATRSDPNSPRDAFALAADPRYRVFVLYLDAYSVSRDGSHRLRMPITQMLNRLLGPTDLLGLLTPRQRPRIDLILGRLSLTIEEQLTRHSDWGLADDPSQLEPEEIEILAALGDRRGWPVVALRRLDKVYADLEELITLLGDLREERKNIIFFSDSLPSPPVIGSTQTIGPSSRPPMPRIGVSNEGQLTTGARNAAEPDRQRVQQEEARLRAIDFRLRFRDLLRAARQANVAFYPVSPGGVGSFNLMSDGGGNLLTLADQTDGVAVTGTNDLRNGLEKVTADLSSHYVLGYYTSNTAWNGATRKITVKLKSTGETIRARREYRAPTAEEMASIRSARDAGGSTPAPSVEDEALGLLTRLRPGAKFHAAGSAAGPRLAIVAEIAASEIEGGRWKAGADVQVMASGPGGQAIVGKGRIEPGARGTIVYLPVGTEPGPWNVDLRARSAAGDPPESASLTVTREAGTPLLGQAILHRAGSAASSPFRPAAAAQFRRTERLRVAWPILGDLEKYEGRLLDRAGQPSPVPVQVSLIESADGKALAADVNLAPLANGDYLVEIVGEGGGRKERKLVAVRVSLAR